MEDNKPTYQEIENELNEYKQLLWQLSDEYKENLGAAEKKLADLQEKYNLQEKKEQPGTIETGYSFISKLGLPACVLNNEGKISDFNNKFKFLVELMSFEIEDVLNITYLLQRDENKQLVEKYENFQKKETGVFQCLLKVRNAFQNTIIILMRIYRIEEKTDYLALFIEIHKDEIQELTNSTTKNNPGDIECEEEVIIEKEEIIEAENENYKEEIAIFSEKYEVFTEIDKLFKSKDSAQNNLKKEITGIFDLNNTRKKLLEKLNSQYKNFIKEFLKEYPDLTGNEEKHCMLIKAGLTYKEIAALMNISINGVKIARNRLRKKLKLENETKTSEFIAKF